MKTLKLLTAGALALSFTGFASAATTVYLTGSTAYRSQTVTAILTLLGSANASSSTPTLPNGSGYIFENSATDVHKSNAQTFVGTSTTTNDALVIKCSWSGSAAGVQSVAVTDTSKFKVLFLPDNVYTIPINGSGSNTNVLDPRKNSNPAESATAEIAMADNWQSSTPFNGTFLNVAYTDLTDTDFIVGVVAFQWVKSKGAPATLTDMTPQLARATWKAGKLPLSFYTGNSADVSTLIYATGRDIDSGTRIGAFAESGVGINSTVQQYDCNTEALYTAQTINGVSCKVGQGGESSGGTLAGTSKMGKSGLTKAYVAYMSTGDAGTLVGNGGGTLTYNGVAYSDTAVKQGKYTFWAYEHLMYRPSLAGVKLQFATDLTSAIDTVATIRVSDMTARRTTDGGTVTN